MVLVASGLCGFELPVRVGGSDADYNLPLLVKRLGDPDERYSTRAARITADDIPALEMKDDIVTPHRALAKPHFRGPLRALVLTDQMQGREIIELTQRMQLEPIVPLATVNRRPFTGDLYGKYTTEMAQMDLTHRLAKGDFEVIVIGGGCQIWTAEHRKTVAEHVRAGKGLVWIGAPAPAELADILPLTNGKGFVARAQWKAVAAAHPVTDLMPFELLPTTTIARTTPADGAQVLATAGNGLPLIAAREAPDGGRVLQMTYVSSWGGYGGTFSGITPYDFDYARAPWPYWEYWYSLAARAILWTGRREAPARPTVQTDVDAKPGVRAGCRLTVGIEGDAGNLPGLTVEMVLRDLYGAELLRKTMAWVGKPLTFQPPNGVGAGAHFADVRVLAQGKVVCWGSRGFVVSGGSIVQDVAVEGGDNAVVAEGDVVAVTIRLSHAPQDCRVVAELVDGVDRVLARAVVPAAPETRLELPARDSLHAGGHLVVRLMHGDTELHRVKRFATVLTKAHSEQRWDDFVGIVWGQLGAYQRSWLGRYKAEIMRELGYSAHHVIPRWSPFDALWTARCGFRPVGFSATSVAADHKHNEEVRKAYRESGDKMTLRRKPCLSEPDTMRTLTGRAVTAAKTLAPFRPIAYNFGDELSYAPNGLDFDFTPAALQEMRTWLKTQYPSLAALNAEWESSFATWDAVVPSTSREAVSSGRYAAWADHRLFACHSVAESHRRFIAAMKAVDPRARYGLSGTQVPYPYNGMDWARAGPVFSYHSNYDGGGELPALHVATAPGCRLAQWSGYRYKGLSDRSKQWRRFLSGQAGISYYEQFSMLNPDLRPSQSGQVTGDAIRDLRTGLGKLLIHAKAQRDRVALYYSMPSILGLNITGMGEHKVHRYGWLWALRDCGFEPRYLTYLDVRENGIDRKRVDVTVLPMAVALAPKEAAALRRFVSEGGTLIADGLAGVLSGHCRRLQHGALDDVFGVAHADAWQMQEAVGELAVAGSAHGLSFGEWTTGTRLVGGRVSVSTGKALGKVGDTPALVVNRFGRGKALYLNLSMARYTGLRDAGTECEWRERLRTVLAWAGATTPIVVSSTEDEPIPRLTVQRCANGAAMLLGLVLEQAESVPAQIAFPTDGHLYDMRRGGLVGTGRELKITLPAMDALVLALTPYRVKALTVAGGAAAAGQPAVLDAQIAATGDVGLHCLRVEVSGPDGKARPWLAQNTLAPAGRAQVRIPFALNDVPGDYRVRVRDVTTGVTGEATVTLAEGQ